MSVTSDPLGCNRRCNRQNEKGRCCKGVLGGGCSRARPRHSSQGPSPRSCRRTWGPAHLGPRAQLCLCRIVGEAPVLSLAMGPDVWWSIRGMPTCLHGAKCSASVPMAGVWTSARTLAWRALAQGTRCCRRAARKPQMVPHTQLIVLASSRSDRICRPLSLSALACNPGEAIGEADMEKPAEVNVKRQWMHLAACGWGARKPWFESTCCV